jgi:uncharacterized membrane protein (UPF0127 family)
MIRCAIAAFILTAKSAVACAPETVELRGDFGAARFTVELADEPAERNLGLMNRESMPMSSGMLFVYEAPQRATFWMRNTLIPLDMIFADETGVVTRVHRNAVLLDETLIDGGSGVKYVLEINGGLSEAMGIEPGTQMRHDAMDQSTVMWPCD